MEVEFFYDPKYGDAWFHQVGYGYYQFGDVAPDFKTEDQPPDLTGFVRFIPEATE